MFQPNPDYLRKVARLRNVSLPDSLFVRSTPDILEEFESAKSLLWRSGMPDQARESLDYFRNDNRHNRRSTLWLLQNFTPLMEVVSDENIFFDPAINLINQMGGQDPTNERVADLLNWPRNKDGRYQNAPLSFLFPGDVGKPLVDWLKHRILTSRNIIFPNEIIFGTRFHTQSRVDGKLHLDGENVIGISCGDRCTQVTNEKNTEFDEVVKGIPYFKCRNEDNIAELWPGDVAWLKGLHHRIPLFFPEELAENNIRGLWMGFWPHRFRPVYRKPTLLI